MRYNVYEQRFPINAGRERTKGKTKGDVIWQAHLHFCGIMQTLGGDAIAQAKKFYGIKAPILHKVDSSGNEVFHNSTRDEREIYA